MVAEFLIKQIQSLQVVNYMGVEDFSDRLSFMHTVTVLLVCCSIVTVRTYFFHPLSCYIPNSFGVGGGGQELFVNNYCWTEGTYGIHPRYFVIENEAMDGGMSKYKQHKIVYYQWVPFVLGIQCILFYLPRVIWNIVSYKRTGTDIGHILKIAYEAVNAEDDKHDKLINHACRRLEQFLYRSKKHICEHDSVLVKFKKMFCNHVRSRRRKGTLLIFLYLLIKIGYFVNAVGQLLAMKAFLQVSKNYTFFGVALLLDIFKGLDWENNMVFPRVGCCAVFMKTGAQGNWQFSQCTLPINMINEKVYIFLWFWILFVSVITFISIISWIIRIWSNACNTRFVRQYLRLADNYDEIRKNPLLKKFEVDFLQHDGTFLMKMIALNCGDIICSEILQTLWIIFLKKKNIYIEQDDTLSMKENVGGLFTFATDPSPLSKTESRSCLLKNGNRTYPRLVSRVGNSSKSLFEINEESILTDTCTTTPLPGTKPIFQKSMSVV